MKQHVRYADAYLLGVRDVAGSIELRPIDVVSGAIKVASAVIGLIAAILKLPGGILPLHRLLFICLIVYVIADLAYYSLAQAPRLPIRVAKWVLGPAVVASALYYWLSFKSVVPPVPPNPHVGWVVATIFIIAYLVFDVSWCFVKRHYDRWEVAVAATLIGGCYAWILI